MINFTRAFDSAWERMVIMLFRPFRLEKWCVIGFSAFLAGLLSGGNGYSGGFNWPPGNTNFQSQQFHFGGSPITPTHFTNPLNDLPWAGTSMALIIVLSGVLMVFLIALGLLCCWLGARGQFLLLDNIVRDRGAIVEPWTAYAAPANRVFGLYVLLSLLGLALLIPFVGAGVLIALPVLRHQHALQHGDLLGFGILGCVYLLLAIPWTIFLFLYREWGVPLVFRNHLSVRESLRQVWFIIRTHPGATALFVLLRIALFIGLAIVSIGLCCTTCCLGALPYVGTVLLLPALLFVKCFSLDCLAQFGPAYDVWTVDVPPTPAPPVPSPPDPAPGL